MTTYVPDFLRAADLEPAERAALDHGLTVWRGQGYTLRVNAATASPTASSSAGVANCADTTARAMEDQLGALGRALNAVVPWNTVYLDRAVARLAADGFLVTDDLTPRRSPLQFNHMNFLGRYAFARTVRACDGTSTRMLLPRLQYAPSHDREVHHRPAG